jgi:hypothetical protein
MCLKAILGPFAIFVALLSVSPPLEYDFCVSPPVAYEESTEPPPGCPGDTGPVR